VDKELMGLQNYLAMKEDSSSGRSSMEALSSTG